jgi:hypothetical protein
MLNCRHGACRYPTSGGDPGKSGGFGQGPSRRLAGIEDCGPSFDCRRATTWMDSSSSGLDPDEPESLDPSRKLGRNKGSEEKNDSGPTVALNTSDCPGSGAAFGTVAPRFWSEPGSMGRPHAGGAPKATLRAEDEGAAGPEMDASIGISAKTSQLFLSSSSDRRGEAISPGVKKNFKIWGRGKRWFFRMKQGSACIPAWDGDGPREDILFASRQRANTSSVLICRGGWPRFWGASG